VSYNCLFCPFRVKPGLNIWVKHEVDPLGELETEGDRAVRQGCGSGSGLDPDSETLWIRIHIGNPDPDPGARKLRNFSGKSTFWLFLKKIFNTERCKIALTTF
jgi:hypothetical protein